MCAQAVSNSEHVGIASIPIVFVVFVLDEVHETRSWEVTFLLAFAMTGMSPVYWNYDGRKERKF